MPWCSVPCINSKFESASIFSTVIACFGFEEHRRFVFCENDPVCFDIALTRLEDRVAFDITMEKTLTDISKRTPALEVAARFRMFLTTNLVGTDDPVAPKRTSSFLKTAGDHNDEHISNKGHTVVSHRLVQAAF